MNGQQNISGKDDSHRRRRQVLVPYEVTYGVGSPQLRRPALLPSRHRNFPEEDTLVLHGSVTKPPRMESSRFGHLSHPPSSISMPVIRPTHVESHSSAILPTEARGSASASSGSRPPLNFRSTSQQHQEDIGAAVSSSGNRASPSNSITASRQQHERRHSSGGSTLSPASHVNSHSTTPPTREVPENEFFLQASNCFINDSGVQEIDDFIGNKEDWYRWCFASTYIQNMDRKIRRALGRTSDRVFNED